MKSSWAGSMAEGGGRTPLAPLRHHRQVLPVGAVGAAAPQQRPRPRPPPPGAPRALVLHRQEGHDFGFTLRHLIVYPPETYDELLHDRRHAAVGAVSEPMDTIFVRSVREGGAAARAGVRPGDRLLGVEGRPVAGCQYAQVVQLIQRAPGTLHLHLVPKEADVLQRYFSEAAYNPETNQRPRSRTRERRTSTGEMPLTREMPIVRDLPLAREMSLTREPGRVRHVPNTQEVPLLPLELLGLSTGGPASHQMYTTPQLHYRPANTTKAVMHEYSIPAEQRPRVTIDHRKAEQRHNPTDNGLRIEPVDRTNPGQLTNAEIGAITRSAVARPQVPPQPNRSSRRASDGARLSSESYPYYASPPSSPFTSSKDSASVYTSGESIPSSYKNQLPFTKNSFPTQVSQLTQTQPMNNGKLMQYSGNFDSLPLQYSNRFNFEDRRESNTSLTSSAAESKDSLSSFESISTLTGHETDDSIFYSRIRKSLEQKEAFLRRPSQPTGWVTPEDQVVIQQKEFYARPQKLHKSVWPPQFIAGDQSPSRNKENIQENVLPDLDSGYSEVNSENQASNQASDAEKSDSNSKSGSSKQKHDKAAFVSTLSKISENAASSIDSADSMTNGSPASPSSLEAMLQEKRYHIPSELQIVSNRTRQFESQPSQERTALYRSELARLSTKRPEPSVALRRKEFESRAGKRDAKSLEAQQSLDDAELHEVNLSGNRLMITGSKHLTCPPPEGYNPDSERVLVRMRSNSTGSEGLPTRRTHASAEEERAMRRVSYLKATWGDRLPLDSDQELSDGENQILRRVKKEREQVIDEAGTAVGEELEKADISMQGSVQVKMVLTNGKRASDRSWKQAWAVLQGPKLTLYRHQHQSPTPGGSSESLNLRFSMADVAGDYTKRKHVVRVTSIAGAELLLQGGGAAEAARWLTALRTQTPGAQVGEPQQAPDSPAETVGLSPPPRSKKSSNSRTMSPTETSTAPLTASPKSKTWKGRVARQLRRMQAGGTGGGSPGTAPPSGPVGVPLECCDPLSDRPLVPHLVGLCTRAVEERGLHVVGVYRVPGNTASVTALLESLGKGIPPDLQDQRWNDVNVVSSLLKAFFRRLPNPLLTKDRYPLFISADKLPDNSERVKTIRRLIRGLPEHHYETLKFLMEHLKRVVAESSVNKMEARNLAIVFGPTLVRSADDNMLTMVSDMSSQCRIIESLINHMDWYFDEEDRSSPSADNPCEEELQATSSNHALLLQNVKKIEGKGDVSTKDIMSSIISAANRKIQRKPRSKHNSASAECSSPVHVRDQQEAADKAAALALAAAAGGAEQQPGGRPLSPPLPPATHRPQLHIDNDNYPIKTYTGLDQTTQERVKRFEMETRADLRREKRRDQNNDWQANSRHKSTAVSNTGNGASTKSAMAPGRVSSPAHLQATAASELDPAAYIGHTNAAYFTKPNSSEGKRLKTDSNLSGDSFSDGIVDMVSSLTSTFDQKLRSLHNSSPLADQTIPFVDDSHEESQDFGDPSLHRASESLTSQEKLNNDLGSDSVSKSESDCTDSPRGESPKSVEHDKAVQDLEEETETKLLQEHYTPENSDKDASDSSHKNSSQCKNSVFSKSIENESESEKDIDITSAQCSPSDVTPDNERNVDKFNYCSFQDDKTNEKIIEVAEQETNKNTLQSIFFKKGTFNSDKSDALNVSLLIKSKLKRSESLNRETEKQIIKNNNKLIISENLSNNKNEASDSGIDVEKSNSPKLRRSVSLNRSSDGKVKRSDSLTKNEKTETNLIRRREIYNGGMNRASAKLKRKNGMPERSIKRRHTVGGTIDLDKNEWAALGCSRTSSPDLPASSLDAQHCSPLLQHHTTHIPLESHV